MRVAVVLASFWMNQLINTAVKFAVGSGQIPAELGSNLLANAGEAQAEHDKMLAANAEVINRVQACLHGGTHEDYIVPESPEGQTRLLIEFAKLIGYFKHFPVRVDSKGDPFVASTLQVFNNDGTPKTKDGDGVTPVFSAVRLDKDIPTIPATFVDEEGNPIETREMYANQIQVNISAWKLKDSPKQGKADPAARSLQRTIQTLEKQYTSMEAGPRKEATAAKLNTLKALQRQG